MFMYNADLSCFLRPICVLFASYFMRKLERVLPERVSERRPYQGPGFFSSKLRATGVNRQRENETVKLFRFFRVFGKDLRCGLSR